MRPLIYLLLLAGVLGISASAQIGEPDPVALPANIAEWGGEDSDKILHDPTIKTRLIKLMGERNYESFMESLRP